MFSNSACYTLRANISSSQFKVEESQDGAEISIYPVPTTNGITVAFNSSLEDEITVCIFNSLGERMYQGKQRVLEGFNLFNLDVSAFPSGIYFLQLMCNNIPIQQKFVVDQ